MFRVVRFFCVLAMLCGVFATAGAQNLYGIARIDAARTAMQVVDDGLNFELGLSVAVPFRVFAISDPARVVLDFKEVDWEGFDLQPIRDVSLVADVRVGLFRPGWSRMVIDLETPLGVKSAQLRTLDAAALAVSLSSDFPTGAAENNSKWLHTEFLPPEVAGGGRMIVAIDPGHGGIDPGAIRDRVAEKDIALQFSRELRDLILASGEYSVVLTRDSDVFMSLSDRVRAAHAAKADVLLSIHANTVTEGNATGATIYSLSDKASDAASERLAALENRSDIDAGLALSVEEDDVARVLLDLARAETNPRSRRFAQALVEGVDEAVGVIRSRPHRSAGFLVLKSPDIPSLLLELGFLSNEQDRYNMLSPQWRERAAMGVLEALRRWSAEDQSLSQLLMK